MQVAIEVEREVVDYREPFCSPSPEDSSGDVKLAQSSLVMEKYKQDQPVKDEVNVNVAFPGKTLASSSSSPKDDNLNNSETDVEPDTCHDGQLMQIEDAYESIVKSDRDRCDFDLNEDIGNEEYDCLVNPLSSNSVSIPAPSVSVSTPIAVAASKGAPLLPIAPLCFEGELGWKGSAATSAFRPASPRKTDAEKRSAGQKRKSNFMEIDLNVAENGDDDVVVGPVAIKATPVSSGFRSQDDSMEVSSRRADRLKLDLNRLGDDDMSPDQLLYRRLPHRSSEQTLSSASSSSSRQPLMRDFDLNDNPGFFDAIGSYNVKNSSAKTTGMYDSSKFDVSAITIMGSRMAVERKDFLGDTRQSLMGTGQSIEPSTIMASRPMLPYNHIPLSTYGYNAQVMGPPVPFTPSVYGPGNSPYMVDSRGTTAVPQIAGGAGVHGAPSATPSFLMSVPNAPLTLNFMGSSQSFFDLNSAMSTMEAANRDAGSLKHAFMQGHKGLWEKR
ncbi:uncharacterized protein M6B38_404185 [Iris pallida]|uniref:Uncharacterized protein n=1 Tax=Iris pallida TaxID=29817 RepID=A0AAX6FR48_IRIPA|nr:uncharacterized protein M6B38_404185 [Iris pallida]